MSRLPERASRRQRRRPTRYRGVSQPAAAAKIGKRRVRCRRRKPRTARECLCAREQTQNFNRKAGLRRCFGSRFVSGRRIKRLVKNSCCALCGDIKYIPPRREKLPYKRKSMSRPLASPGRPERAKRHSVSEADRLVSWLGEYPKVKLCDIAKVYDVTSRGFSCILPLVLRRHRKCKRVQCFMKQFGSLTHLYGHRARRMVSRTWKVCTPTNSCASLLSGEVTQNFDRTLGALAERIPVNENGGPTSGEGSSGGTTCTHEETSGSGEQGSLAVSTVQDKKEAPCILACNASASTQLCQHVSDSLVAFKKKTPGSGEESEEETYPSHIYSCQRTCAYVGWTRSSCARTYWSWPFPRRGPPCEMKSSVRTGPRWIENLESSECKVGASDVCKRNSPACLRKLVKERLRKLIRPKETDLAVNNLPSQTQDSKLTNTEQDCPLVLQRSKDPKCQKEPDDSDSTMVSSCKLSIVNQSATIEAVEKNQIEDENNNTPKVGFNQAQVSSPSTSRIVTKSGKVTVFTDTNSEEGKSPSVAGTLGFKSNFTVRIEPSCSPPSPFSDLRPKLNTLQTALHKVYPRDQIYPSSPVMEGSRMEPQLFSSVMEHFTEGQNLTTESTPNYNPDLWSPKISISVLSPAKFIEGGKRETQFNSPTGEDAPTPPSASCVDEVSSLSCDSSPEKDDAKTLKISEGIEAHQIPSPERPADFGCDLDIMRAYAEDAIVLDVIQDDPDLFGAVVTETPRPPSSKTALAGVQKDYNDSGTKKKSPARVRQKIFWESRGSPSESDLDTGDFQSNDGFHTEAKSGQRSSSWSLLTPFKTEQSVTSSSNNPDKRANAEVNVATVENSGSGFRVNTQTQAVNDVAGRAVGIPRPSSSTSRQYCWYFFSEHHFCLRWNCQFLHLPMDEDEKFCMEMVQKFCRVGSPHILQRAVELFVGYYSRSSPGLSFSQNIVNLLLSTLLSLAQLRDLDSVLKTLLAHSKTPSPEFSMAFYEHVRKRGLISSVPGLIHLTSKMVEAGCVFTIDQFEVMQADLQMLQVPRHQMDVFHSIKCRGLVIHPHTAMIPKLTQSVMQVELCKQQENWASLARVFYSVCNARHSTGELASFCCCVTTALLQEPKDRLTLPYEPFAESVCQKMPFSGLVRSFLGRVGVSLMLIYYRAQEWQKGMKLVNVMSRLNVEFSTLKGYSGSEEGASRCRLATTATELFLNSGSIEGALNVLRADEWFVSSSAWPCEPADIDSRRRVLLLLAGKTSLRDTLEVLSNLPGLKQPVDGVQAGEYSGVFNAHLQRCVTNQVLPVAADTLEFMLTQGMPAVPSQLQNLIHRLGKQNSWSRARTLFKCARSAGYYSEVVCEKDSLALPSGLSEIEMTLAFEMLIACSRSSLQSSGDPSQPLVITLRRSSGGEAVMESDYLASGSCLLSAALIPNPKLTVHYSGVTQDQEQVFHMDRKSAIKWLTHNGSWAGMWTS